MSKYLYKDLSDKINLKYLFLPFFVCSFQFIVLTLVFGLNGPYVTDFIVCLLASYLLYLVSKDNLFYVVNVLFMILTLYVISRVKMQYLGSPVQASDILSVIALYDIQNVAVKSASIVSLLAFILIFIINLRYTTKNLLRIMLFFLIAPGSYLYAYSALNCVSVVHSCSYTYEDKNQSAIKQFALSLIDLGRELYDYPSKKSVMSANVLLNGNEFGLNKFYSGDIRDKRNVYFILVESLWDPESISSLKFNHDPFYGEFRKLWQKGGGSIALSPVFGGGTANPEFELLCGLPITTNVITFELPVLNSDLPCLPNLLNKYGYATIASHPNVRGFWNRDEAYPRLGFERYYAIDDFKKDDVLSQTYLSDNSLYLQNMRYVSSIKKPIFNYVLTVSEHYPYVDVGNENRTIVVSPSNEYLSRYANLVHLGTKQLSEFYTRIRDRDPDALIVILGDHLPLLGKDFEVYRDNGFFDGVRDHDAKKILNMFSVPLVIINGNEGPVDVGAVSTYEIPLIIARFLFEPATTLGRTRNVPDVTHYRPLANKGVLFDEGEGWRFCQFDSALPECEKALAWLTAARTLNKDLIIGDKLSLTNPSAVH